MGNSEKKLCIVVGVGPGMGMAIARRFAEKGFRIAMLARSRDKLNSYENELSEQGHESTGYPCDVSDFDSLAGCFEKIQGEKGPAEVLVYNVSILRPGSPSEISPPSFLADFKINVGGALIAYQKMIPQMKNNKDSCIIITGGGLSTNPFHEFASLGVGKAGLRNMALSMAQEGAKFGVRVVTITIKGMIKEGTFFDPEKISLEFWNSYKHPGSKKAEIVFEETN